jgi:hypothetical protein
MFAQRVIGARTHRPLLLGPGRRIPGGVGDALDDVELSRGCGKPVFVTDGDGHETIEIAVAEKVQTALRQVQHQAVPRWVGGQNPLLGDDQSHPRIDLHRSGREAVGKSQVVDRQVVFASDGEDALAGGHGVNEIAPYRLADVRAGGGDLTLIGLQRGGQQHDQGQQPAEPGLSIQVCHSSRRFRGGHPDPLCRTNSTAGGKISPARREPAGPALRWGQRGRSRASRPAPAAWNWLSGWISPGCRC